MLTTNTCISQCHRASLQTAHAVNTLSSPRTTSFGRVTTLLLLIITGKSNWLPFYGFRWNMRILYLFLTLPSRTTKESYMLQSFHNSLRAFENYWWMRPKRAVLMKWRREYGWWLLAKASASHAPVSRMPATYFATAWPASHASRQLPLPSVS